MSISDQITRLNNAKAAIKQSIENKGVSVSDTAKLDEYPALINSITAGSGGGETNNYYWPEFFELRSRKANYLFADMEILATETRYKDLIENYDVSKNTSFLYTFDSFCYSYSGNYITELDLTKWDVSKGYSFTNTFDSCRLDYLNISGWDFSSILSSAYLQLFMGTYIKEINMANCNTSNVRSLYRFAYQASNLVSIDMTGCDTSNVTAVTGMFYSCKALTTVTGELDLSGLTGGFNPSSAPLNGCTSLETLYLKNIYKNVTTMKNEAKWSINLGVTKVKDECLIYIINELPDLINDKGLTATDKIVLTLPPTNTLTAEQVQVARDKGWQVANTTY